MQDIYKRLARVEAMTSAQKAELYEVLRKAYDNACAAGNAEEAAALARKLRNKLLDSTDKEMSLDRLELDTSTIVAFVSSLRAIHSGPWAKYRQALRDLPQQEGFPFDIKFPTPPDSEPDSETKEDK